MSVVLRDFAGSWTFCLRITFSEQLLIFLRLVSYNLGQLNLIGFEINLCVTICFKIDFYFLLSNIFQDFLIYHECFEYSRQDRFLCCFFYIFESSNTFSLNSTFLNSYFRCYFNSGKILSITLLLFNLKYLI